ncbi:hypothetical protein HDV01_005521 [Terramyces sp. JEL0728]|nr:hypothetical protein HDV01_005521 [Terramyces sp. JEL0728]
MVQRDISNEIVPEMEIDTVQVDIATLSLEETQTPTEVVKAEIQKAEAEYQIQDQQVEIVQLELTTISLEETQTPTEVAEAEIPIKLKTVAVELVQVETRDILDDIYTLDYDVQENTHEYTVDRKEKDVEESNSVQEDKESIEIQPAIKDPMDTKEYKYKPQQKSSDWFSCLFPCLFPKSLHKVPSIELQPVSTKPEKTDHASVIPPVNPQNQGKKVLVLDLDETLVHSSFKDLSVLGRDIKDCTIIDNLPSSYMFQPSNAIPITSWYDDKNDTELIGLIPFLEDLKDVDNFQIVLDTTLEE